MNLVYVCREGNNEELRYSLRSVCQNLEDANVWVVGGKPSWYVGKHIPVRQSNTKYQNVFNNLNAIVNSEDIPDDFIMMNDDFYIVKPIDKVETYNGGYLQDKIDLFSKNMTNSYYIKLLKNTKDRLASLGIDDPLDYAIHVPMEFNKEKLSTVIKPRMSYRTLYGNIYNVGGIKISDVKIHSKNTRDWADTPDLDSLELPYLSTNDASFEDVYRNILKDMFPDPCRFESKKLRGK